MRTVFAALLLSLACLCAAQDQAANNLADLRALKVAAPKKWAVVIGASDYSEMGELKYARGDAKEFAQVLIDEFTFKPEDVTLLVDKDQPDRAPTAANIAKSLDRIFKNPKLDRGDLFIFYFNGHGVGTKNGDFLCPTDAKRTDPEKGSLPVKEVMKRIVATGMKNVLIIADACRAGEKNPFGTELQELGNKANLAVMLGCAPGKRSYEYPSLKGGAFTHFLLESMKSPETRLGSGTLWASKIASRVQKEVYEFTERDHGKYAQQPAVWNEERQDVLLGQFTPTGTVETLAFTAALDYAKKKGPHAYQLALAALAELHIHYLHYAKAIEYYKILDQLGAATPKSLYRLASLLIEMGREKEARLFLDRLIADAPSDYWKTASIAIYPGSRYSQAEQFEANRRLWRLSHDPDDGVFLIFTASLISNNLYSEVAAEVGKFYTQDPRMSLYCRAEAELARGDKTIASDLLWQCVDGAGSTAPVHQALLRLLELQLPKPNSDILLKIHAKGIKLDSDALYFWIVQEAQRLRDAEDPEGMMKMIRNGLRGVPMPPEVLELTVLAGQRAKELLPDLEKHITRHPLSWEPYAARWIAQQSDSISPNFRIPDEVLKYVDDPVDVRLQLFNALERVIEDGEVSSTQSLLFNTKFFISVNQFNERFTLDDDLWTYMQRWAENSRRTQQLAKLATAKLYPGVYEGKRSARLMDAAMRIAMNAGDDEAVDRLWKAAEKGGALKTELAWQYLVYKLLRGDTKTAESLLPKMPAPTVFVGAKAPVVVRAYLDLFAGKDKAGIQKILEANEPEGFQDQYVWLMAQGLTGKAEQTASYFVKAALKDDEYDLYSTGAGLRWAWKYLADAGKEEDMCAVAELSSRFFGNPNFAEIGYLPNPKLADYEGSVTFSAQYMGIEGKRPQGSETLQISIDGAGNAKLTMKGLTASGKIDRFGNLKAEGLWDGDKVSFTMKIAPPSYYKSHPDKGTDYAEVINSHFEQIYFELRVASG